MFLSFLITESGGVTGEHFEANMLGFESQRGVGGREGANPLLETASQRAQITCDDSPAKHILQMPVRIQQVQDSSAGPDPAWRGEANSWPLTSS